MHMEQRDIAFTKRYKIYMAEFLEWAREAEDSEVEYIIDDIDLVLMTFQEREGLYTKKEVGKVRQAGEFLCTVGYPSEKEAIHLIRDGNLVSVPYSIEDICRYYTMFGPQVEAVRGKMAKQHAESAERVVLGPTQ